MSRRRHAPLPASPAPAYRVQVLRPDGTSHVPLSGPLRVGPAGEVVAAGTPTPTPAVELVRVGESVVVRPLGEGGAVRLNEVQLTAPAPLRPGDQLALGSCRVTLVRHSPLPGVPELRPTWQLEPWLEAMVARAERRGGTLALTEEPLEDAQGVAGIVFALGTGARLRLSGVEVPVHPASRGRALYPRDGTHAPALLARVLGAQDAGEELPLVREPVMVRLSELIEYLARLRVPALLEGEAGVGKALWARRLLQLSGVGPVMEVGGAGAPLEALAAPALLVEDVDRLPPEAQEALAARQAGLLVGTTRRPEALVPALAERFAQGRVVVPPLRDRPAELSALVEAELGRMRERLGRPGLHLDAQARALVLADSWPGNVDALKAALWRAARVAVGDGVQAEDLPARLRAEGARLGVSAAKAAAEKAALLAELVDAGWNVTEASRRMGVPRRTVVHRMAVLGLRRPQRR